MVHIVQSGDTLFSIADFYGVSIAALSQANGLSTESVLHPEEALIIPISTTTRLSPPPTATASNDEALHTVQEGESLTDIAQRYGISMQQLLDANSLQSGAGLTAGDTLVIPLADNAMPTSAPAPTATPTPGEPYAAPHLLFPVQNAQVRPDERVVLQWTSVGLLAEDEWYALSLRYLGIRADGQPSEIVVYTRITSWRIPDPWMPDPQAAERRFEWMVQVVRRSDLGQQPVALSLPSSVRRFRW
jgi:LysM repeat protein